MSSHRWSPIRYVDDDRFLSRLTENMVGIGLVLTLANLFRRASYWAKDILIVIPQHGSIGMQAFMHAHTYTLLNGAFPGTPFCYQESYCNS